MAFVHNAIAAYMYLSVYATQWDKAKLNGCLSKQDY